MIVIIINEIQSLYTVLRMVDNEKNIVYVQIGIDAMQIAYYWKENEK